MSNPMISKAVVAADKCRNEEIGYDESNGSTRNTKGGSYTA